MRKLALMAVLLIGCGEVVPVVEDSGSGGGSGGGSTLQGGGSGGSMGGGQGGGGGGGLVGGGSGGGTIGGGAGGGTGGGGGGRDAGTGGGMGGGTGGALGGGTGGGTPVDAGQPDAGGSTCGGAGQACCASGIACNTAGGCENGICVTCGYQTGTCCAPDAGVYGTACNAITNYCSGSNTCASCGSDFQPCCDNAQCNSGLECQTTTSGGAGMCRTVGAVCGGSPSVNACYVPGTTTKYCNAGFVLYGTGTSICTPCGGSNQLACPGNICNPNFGLDPFTGRCRCGGEGQPCCAITGVPQCSSSGLTCDNGTCRTPDAGSGTNCGGPGQPCCGGNTCSAYNTCQSGSCVACGGGPGQPCCPGDQFACRLANNQCRSGTCQTCGPGTGFTCGCGGPYQPCCAGNVCSTGTCFTQLNPPQCASQPCGSLGTQCCGGTSCPNSPLHRCVGGNRCE